MKNEKIIDAQKGWFMLLVNIVVYPTCVASIPYAAYLSRHHAYGDAALAIHLIATFLLLFLNILISCGFTVVQPNQAAVLLLFGTYLGSIKKEGFYWVNPFYTKKKISLRLRNLNGNKLKVNDSSGNPIEIAAVIVWKVEDTFAAFFDVDDYMSYVDTQSESALRHLASAYPYDSWEEKDIISLRANIDEVSAALEKELRDRLHKAGVLVLEARLSHLAYAPEIAEAMLKRQQASAIIAARQKIVEGAVGMVRMALEHLHKDNIIELDDERKAAMVSNLLVVLCGETQVQPVVNTGTLYT